MSKYGWFVEPYPKQGREFQNNDLSQLHTEADARSVLEDSTPADNWASILDEVAYEFGQTNPLPPPYAIALGPHKARSYTLGVADRDPSDKR